MDYCRRVDWGDAALGEGVAAPDPRYALPGTEPRYAPDRAVDTLHIRLAVDLDLGRRALRGRCTTTLRAFRDGVQEVGFDAVALRAVRVAGTAGRRLPHRYDGRRLTVRLPRPLAAGEETTVRVDYRVVRPALGLYFIRPDRAYPRRPTQVWSQCQDEYARYWFPCHDAPGEKATTEIVATVPAGFVAVSNGRLVARRRAGRGGRVTYHWRLATPHSPYLVTLAVGRFRELRDTWGGIPVTYYCERGREADMRRAFGKTPKALAFFSRRIGVRYPYEKYAQVAAADFIYGGMENTSATTQTDVYLHDARAHLEVEPMATGLMAHELAHQWYGDLLTCRDWGHAWLNESFATYFDALFTEHDRGPDDFALEMWANARGYFEEDRERYRRPIVTNLWKQPSDLFDRHLYEKGACVLHMLRHVLGDGDFWRALRHYTRKHRGGSVETADLVVAIEEATGRNLRRFFDQWVYRAGHPEYRVVYWWEPAARRAHVVVRQTQKTGDEVALFAMPLEVEFAWGTGRDGRQRVSETVDAREHHFTYRLPREPRMVRVDPDHWLLARWDVTLPVACWRAALTDDPHPVGRIAAAQALGRLGVAEAVAWLAAALPRERHFTVQGEIAAALGQIRSEAALVALLGAVGLRDPRARRAVARALGEFRSPRAVPALARLVREDPSDFVVADALRALGRGRDGAALPVLTGALRRADSWNDTVRVGAVDGLADLGAPGVLATLRALTRYGLPHPARMAAVRMLGQLGKGDTPTLRTLLARTDDPFLRVRLAAIAALGKLGDDRALPRLARLADLPDVDGRVRRLAAEALRAIRGDAEKPAPRPRPPARATRPR